MKTFGARVTTREAIMLDNATLGQLHDLRLSAMASCFRDQLNRNNITSLSFEERFGMVVEAEWLNRRNKRFNRLIRQAGFRLPAVLEDIDYSGKHGITKPEMLKLSLGTYIKRAQNAFFSGPTGVGKTFLVCALGRAACAQGVQTLYSRVTDFFSLLFSPKNNSRHKPFRDKFASVPLLILDDWGLKKFSPEESHELSELFERRYGRAATVISGQIPCTAWHDLFPDPTQADSILDRLVHNAYVYNITGESMRKSIGQRDLEMP
jgi:DNA replication protein DnaC